MISLTSRQYEVLTFIQQFAQARGYPPTIREIGHGMRIKSLRGVTGHLEALARKGYLRRSRRARGLQLTAGAPPAASVVSLPLVGRIAAGQPLFAEEVVEESVVVDRRFVSTPGCFVVRVHGESMVEAGIHHGDYVIVRPQATATNGETVAVLIEGEATVKRFFRERGAIRLQPAHPTMPPILLRERDWAAGDLRVLGRVVGLMRKY